MAKRTRKRNPLVYAAARVVGGALVKRGAKTAAKKVVKSKAKSTVKKSTAKKAAPKKKVSSNQSLERRIRSESRGDSRTKSSIDKLRKQEENGLISPRERHNALNRMTKYSKEMRAKDTKGKKIGGIKRDTRTSKR